MTFIALSASFPFSTPSATWPRLLFARPGHTGQAAAASRPGWSQRGGKP